MSEIYFSGDTSRTMHDLESPEAETHWGQVASVFPWAKQADYFSVSSPAHHEVLNDTVVTCCLPLAATQQMVGKDYALGNRKFCLQGRTSFLRLYRVFDGEVPAWLPPSAKILFIGDNHAEYGRPFPEKANTFHDLYFSGDCAEIEAAFKLPERRGAYETFYGITVVDGQPARVKQYVYDDQGGFSDWDVVWLMHAKRLGKLPSN